MIVTQRGATRQRLIEEGVRLFADQGFGATSVAEIELAVGLQPRRGALYKHFANKEDLLDAALRGYLDDSATLVGQIDALDLSGAAAADASTLRQLVGLLGRWFLAEMDRLRDLTRIIEHDGQRLPGVVAQVNDRLVNMSYRTAARLIRAVAPGVSDPEALALVLLGPLVAVRRTDWTFGAPPLGLSDDRVLEAWTATALAILSPGSS